MLYKINMQATGENIKKRCNESDLSIETLSRLLDLDLSTMYYWFNGKTLPRWEIAVNLAGLLGCKLDDLIILEEDSCNE